MVESINKSKEERVMAVENCLWTIYGMEWGEPCRIRFYKELINWINENRIPSIIFKNEIEGFLAEKHTPNLYWWAGD